jgi:hypothetical protein
MNLHCALQALHARGFQTPIWIDALCINQASLEEKNIQIPHMGNIYRQASKVLVWLGGASKVEEEALRALPAVVTALDEAEPSLGLWNAHHNPSEKMDTIFTELGLPDPKSDAWPTIYGLFRRSWFQRLWVLQEIALAKRIEVLCGSVTVDWDLIEKLPRVVYKHRLVRLVSNKHTEDEESRLGFDLLCGFGVCRTWLSKTPEWGVFIPHLLAFIRDRDVKNPVDKIYGVLNLVLKPLRDSILVDYSRPAAEVYADFASRWVLYDCDFSLLSEATGSGTLKMDGLPSWCPNFNSPGPPSRFGGDIGQLSGYHAGFRQPFEAKGGMINRLNPNTITCPGFVVDILKAKVDERRLSFPLTQEGARVLLNWEEECLKLTRSYYLEPIDVPLAYPRTLIAQRILELDGTPRQSVPDCTEVYKEWKLYLQSQAQNGTGFRLSTDGFYYATTVGNTQRGRAFFSTMTGRIGLGPSNLEPGDIVCIFENSPVPFILRYRAPNMPTLLVGEAYIDGLMYGEALALRDMDLIKPMQIPIA